MQCPMVVGSRLSKQWLTSYSYMEYILIDRVYDKSHECLYWVNGSSFSTGIGL